MFRLREEVDEELALAEAWDARVYLASIYTKSLWCYKQVSNPMNHTRQLSEILTLWATFDKWITSITCSDVILDTSVMESGNIRTTLAITSLIHALY